MWSPSPIARWWRPFARRPVVCAVLLAVFGGVAASAAERVESRYVREVWLDPARDRHVNVRITLPDPDAPPAASGPLPVLLFSTPQGFRWGGHTDHYVAMAEALMRQGIVMVAVHHYDLDEVMEPGERFGDIYPGIRTGARNDASVDRFEDLLFVLEQLERIDGEGREDWPGLELERIAVAGHSAGTLTALHLSGMPVRDRDGEVFAVHRDPRVRAFVLYSYPLEYSAPSRADLRQVGPVAGLHVAGSRDHPEYRQTSWRMIGPAPQYWLVVDGDHNVGAFGSDDLVLQVTSDFAAAFQRDDGAARARLRRSELKEHEGDLVEFGVRTPTWRPRPDQRDFVAWVRDFLPWGEWLHTRAIEQARAEESAPR